MRLSAANATQRGGVYCRGPFLPSPEAHASALCRAARFFITGIGRAFFCRSTVGESAVRGNSALRQTGGDAGRRCYRSPCALARVGDSGAVGLAGREERKGRCAATQRLTDGFSEY